MATTLNTAIVSAMNALQGFANQDNFWVVFETAFGQGYDRLRAEQLRSRWLAEDAGIFPEIEILSQETLGSAVGAYSTSTGTIYLSDTFVASATDSDLVRVFLEEYGHFVDDQVNEVDTAGDEGELFSALVRGVELNGAELTRLKTEDDHAVVVIGGQETAIEQAIPLIANYTGLRNARDVRVVGNYAYIADFLSPTDLKIIDISNPRSPILKNSFNNPGNIGGLDVINNFVTVHIPPYL